MSAGFLLLIGADGLWAGPGCHIDPPYFTSFRATCANDPDLCEAVTIRSVVLVNLNGCFFKVEEAWVGDFYYRDHRTPLSCTLEGFPIAGIGFEPEPDPVGFFDSLCDEGDCLLRAYGWLRAKLTPRGEPDRRHPGPAVGGVRGRGGSAAYSLTSGLVLSEGLDFAFLGMEMEFPDPLPGPTVDVPLLVTVAGDGAGLVLKWNDTTLWSQPLSALPVGVPFYATLDAAALAGETGFLSVVLTPEGEADAAVRIFDEHSYVELSGPVPVAGDLSDYPPAPRAGPSLVAPAGVLASPSGGVFVADPGAHRVLHVAETGVVTVVAGDGTSGDDGDGGDATLARFVEPRALALLGVDLLLVADAGAHRVRTVDLGTGLVDAWAGTGVEGFSGDGGPALGAQLSEPSALAVAPDGTVFVADRGNHRVRAVDPGAGTIATTAGDGTLALVSEAEIASASSLPAPQGLLLVDGDRLWVTSGVGHTLHEIDLAADTMSVRAGGPFAGFAGDLGPASEALLSDPGDLVLLDDGALGIADRGNFAVRRFEPWTGRIETVLGTGQPIVGDPSAPENAGKPESVGGLTVLGDGRLVLVEPSASRLRSVEPRWADLSVSAAGLGFVPDGVSSVLPVRLVHEGPHDATGVVFTVEGPDDGTVVFGDGVPAECFRVDTAALECGVHQLASGGELAFDLPLTATGVAAIDVRLAARAIEADGDLRDNAVTKRLPVGDGVFVDGFETGDTHRWGD